jgi:hypothetical protein
VEVLKMLQQTKDFLRYLAAHPGLRRQIAAPPDKSLVYAGQVIRAAWKELAQMKQREPALADFVLLPDVLKTLPAPHGSSLNSVTMLDHMSDLDQLEPWLENGFIAWRAVSGIYASQAIGRVRFYIGSCIKRDTNVFAATEVWVLLRNKKIDPLSREVVEYLVECVRSKRENIGFALT